MKFLIKISILLLFIFSCSTEPEDEIIEEQFPSPSEICENYYDSLKSWPFIEAQKIIEKFGGLNKFLVPKKNYILCRKWKSVRFF